MKTSMKTIMMMYVSQLQAPAFLHVCLLAVFFHIHVV